MGYSESSLRRLVDKIQDGSLSSRDYVFNPSMTSGTVSQRVDENMFDNTSLDDFDNSMVVPDDHDPIDSPTPASMEVEGTDPAYTIDQNYDNSHEPHHLTCF